MVGILFWATSQTYVLSTKGGMELGVNDLALFNKVLFSKWRRTLGKRSHGLWKDVSEPKYEFWRNLNRTGDTPKESWLWKDMRKVCGGKKMKHVVWKQCHMENSKGWKIRLWGDKWMCEVPLIQFSQDF